MSLSITRTLSKQHEGNRGFRAQRPYDYLYDPVFSVSGEMDHVRASCRAQGSVDCLKKVPEFNSMFSDLPHYPSFTLRLHASDPVPAFIDRRWRGHAEQRRETLQTLAGCSGVQLHKPIHDVVNGADRWKFFKRPLVPFTQQIPPDIIFTVPKSDPQIAQQEGFGELESYFQRSVGIQTDYRDSETQTVPYSPEYIIRPGAGIPEILTLATFSWGRGLPAGLDEVEMIERARNKRAWEAMLPPLNDLSQLDKRKRMMDEMEREEWAFREREIEKLQETRLALLLRCIRDRSSKQDKVKAQQLDDRFSQHQREKRERLQKIRNTYTVSLRKLLAKRKNVEGKLIKQDIISKHLDFGSEVYAPLSRHGVFPELHSQRNIVKNQFLDTYQGLLELEAGLLPSILEPQIKAPKPKKKKDFIGRSERMEIELMQAHQALKDKKVQVEEKKPLRFLHRVEKPVPRPLTPVVDVPPEGEEEKELAVIFLQKLLRGRSVQNQMLEGIQKQLEQIQELRTTHALQKEQEELQRADKQVTLALQREAAICESRMSQAQSYADGLSQEAIGEMLDFLAKELVRLQEERRIHAFMLLAERDRNLREAKESGQRQMEERRRREEDEIFRQMMNVHQSTVDLYLEDVILDSTDQTADTQAREEIHRVAEELNNVTYAMEEMRNNVQSEEIVAQLVYSFLIPDIYKSTVRNRVKQSERRHLNAARTLIHGTDSSSTSPVSPSPLTRAATSVLSQIVEQVVETTQDTDHHRENEQTD